MEISAMLWLTKTTKNAPPVAEARIRLSDPRGLDVHLSKRLAAVARAFGAAAVLTATDGREADVRDAFSLMLLGARVDEPLGLRCVGPDAGSALHAIVDAAAAERMA
jgi:phosphotransferase system HPr-like phosphotransfer protein